MVAHYFAGLNSQFCLGHVARLGFQAKEPTTT